MAGRNITATVAWVPNGDYHWRVFFSDDQSKKPNFGHFPSYMHRTYSLKALKRKEVETAREAFKGYVGYLNEHIPVPEKPAVDDKGKEVSSMYASLDGILAGKF